MSKKKSILFFKAPFLIFIAIFSLYLIYAFGSFAYKMWQVKSLAQGYIQVNTDKNKNVEYELVFKRPKDWIVLKDISRHLKNAVIVSEDGTFYKHNGVEIVEIQNAIEDSVKNDKALRGASTISQQLVKNFVLTKEKSFGRKIQEIILSLYMDYYVSKQKIFECYLNIIEYGEGIYGVKNAAKFYFLKHPSQLLPREAAFIAMLLPNPKKYSISFRTRKLTGYAQRQIENIMTRMSMAGYLTQEDFLMSKYHLFDWEISTETPFLNF